MTAHVESRWWKGRYRIVIVEKGVEVWRLLAPPRRHKQALVLATVALGKHRKEGRRK